MNETAVTVTKGVPNGSDLSPSSERRCGRYPIEPVGFGSALEEIYV